MLLTGDDRRIMTARKETTVSYRTHAVIAEPEFTRPRVSVREPIACRLRPLWAADLVTHGRALLWWLINGQWIPACPKAELDTLPWSRRGASFVEAHRVKCVRACLPSRLPE